MLQLEKKKYAVKYAFVGSMMAEKVALLPYNTGVLD